MRKTSIIFISVITVLLLSGVVLATGFIVKTSNPEFRDDPLFYKALGNELAKRGEIDKAAVAYEQSLALAEDLEVRNNLAVIYYREARYPEAIGHLRLLIAAEPSNPGYHYDLAVNLVDKFRNTDDKKLDDLYEALAEYEKASALAPGFSNSGQNIEVLRRVLRI
ncbi:MAG: hypothetical protein V1866_05225 [archaeon]